MEQTNLIGCYLHELGLARETEYLKNAKAVEDT